MRLAFVRLGLVRAGQSLGSRRGITFLFGLIAGWYVVVWFHQLTAVLGLSLTTVTAVAIATALGFELAWRRPKLPLPGESSTGESSSGEEVPVGAFALLCLVPAAWSVGFDWLMQLAYSVIGRFSIETVAAAGPRLLISLGISFLAISIPIYALTRLPIQLTRLWHWRRDDSSPRPRLLSTSVLFFTGIAAGIMIDVLLLAPWFGLQVISFAAIFCSLGLFLLTCKQTGVSGQVDEQSVQTNQLQPQRRRTIGSVGDSAWAASIVLCLGGLTAIAMRMTHQLFPAVGYLVWTEWAVLIAAAAIGLLVAARLGRADTKSGKPRSTSIRSVACLLAAACCGALPILFSWHVSGLLLANSYVEPVWLQMLLRCLVVLTMIGPVGFAWGLLAVPASSDRDKSSEFGDSFPQFSPLAFVAGMIAVRWLLFPQWNIENVLPVIAMLLVITAAVRWLATRDIPRGRLARATVASLLCLAALSPFVRKQYNPAQAARLLFSTQVFLAKRSGVQGSLLPFIDEGRLVARREGEHGTYTVWKMRGIQLQVREGGVPKAIISSDTQICPQFSADIMQAALPILLHENPRRTLLLGLQGGVTLDTCFHFPLQQITCAESDPELIRLVGEVVLTSDKRDLINGDRVKMLTLDPALAVAANDNVYDVIISCPDQSALIHSTPYFTQEFYRNAANRLADDGIFCQRFQYVDYGPEPLRAVTATMRKAFRTVTAIETAAGEFALLGTNSPKGLVRKGLLTRLEANHVRNLLAQVGWDWVVPLNLSAYDNKALLKFADETKAACNTTANGNFTFRLPPEVMRWGAKYEEIRSVLAGRTGSLLQWTAQSDTRDALLRLEEISGRRNIIARYPDEKWAYRKTLRKRMKNKSRSIIEQVKGGLERVLHPDDRRRQDYLKTLSAAVKNPDAESVRRLSEFSHPYDPLVSFFLHDEIARIYARDELSDPQDELRHRLHLVYYTDSHDRSVRNIVAALNLLVEHPEAVPNAIERRDHLDALLQMLKSRWLGRGTAASISKDIALNDVAESVAAMTSAFEAMEKIYADSDLNADDWQARRRMLERSIMRPLRSYRTVLLSQRSATKRLPKKTSQTNAN